MAEDRRKTRAAAPARTLARRLRACDGQAIVEFAVVLPVILILILAVVDIGKAYGYQNDETHLANEAARFAAVGTCGGGCPSIIAQVKSDAAPELRNGTGSIESPISVEICYPDGFAVGNRVVATVTATYKWLPFLVDQIDALHNPAQIVASATSRIESPTPLSEATPC
jgi:hypothetical protein